MSADTFVIDQEGRDTIRGTLHDPRATVGHVLTVQPDKSIAAAPGGGSGPQQVTVEVSSAEILDLANTPVTLIPGVAGKVTVVTGACIALIAGAVPYVDGGGVLYCAAGAGGVIAWVNVGTAGLVDQAADTDYIGNPGGAIGLYAGAALIGEDVFLQVFGGGNPTVGDGTFKVTLAYFLADAA